MPGMGQADRTLRRNNQPAPQTLTARRTAAREFGYNHLIEVPDALWPSLIASVMRKPEGRDEREAA
jgi:hypothetical protein